ncbi:hypothetical protein CFP65_3238 [Kitasatospora sp. MMS16-BH015]|uniref:hypothetical protein n=1 Tax=Kitasatospora sp. MMS16-BH015 TaxID=2018025 RepID=UPI000CA1D834|nr:hypothetical protein [Kitasatospora sp. MMS16-BH015]AUG78041.1 hypothetical protein CFP65_3238 [Kitasatospora sp. MMS16-BH015]
MAAWWPGALIAKDVTPACSGASGGDMRGEALRAAFFDLALISWESFEAARAAIDLHRSSGDLLVLMVPHSAVHLSTDPEAPSGGGTHAVSDLLAGGEDCLRITVSPDEERACTVVEAMMKLGVDAFRCFGYADHREALRTLSVVGNPRILGGDPDLMEYARAQGWPVFSAAASAAG